MGRKARSQRELPRGRGTRGSGAPPSTQAPENSRSRSLPGLSSENSGKISEMWPFVRASLLTLSFSRRRPNTERELDSAVSHACPRTRRDWWSSHTCCTWLHLSFSPSLERTSRIIDSPRGSVSSVHRDSWKLTSASVGAANTIDLDRSAIERTSQSREDFSCRDNSPGMFICVWKLTWDNRNNAERVAGTNLYSKILLLYGRVLIIILRLNFCFSSVNLCRDKRERFHMLHSYFLKRRFYEKNIII